MKFHLILLQKGKQMTRWEKTVTALIGNWLSSLTTVLVRRWMLDFLHLLPHEAAPVGLLFEPLPQRMSTVAVYINLAEHVKLSIVRLCKLFDLSISSWLLQNQNTLKNRAVRNVESSKSQKKSIIALQVQKQIHLWDTTDKMCGSELRASIKF